MPRQPARRASMPPPSSSFVEVTTPPPTPDLYAHLVNPAPPTPEPLAVVISHQPSQDDTNQDQTCDESFNSNSSARVTANFNDTERVLIICAIFIVLSSNPELLPMADLTCRFSAKFYDAVRKELRNNPVIKDKIRLPSDAAPHDRTIRLMYTNFHLTGNASRDKSKSGRKKDEAARERVESLTDTADISTRKVAAQAQTSQRTAVRINHEQKKHYYLAPVAQKLTDTHVKRRKEFANVMLGKIEDKTFDPKNVCWTDEVMIGTNVQPTRRNNGFWRVKGKFDDWREKLFTSKGYDEKVHAFVVLHYKFGALGPYIIEDYPLPSDKPGQKRTLTTERYIHILQNYVVPDVKNQLSLQEFSTCWWQQDGASPHTGEVVLEYLREQFGGRILSHARSETRRRQLFDWPACSPDLNPLDYFFWSSLRKLVWRSAPKTKQDVVNAIIENVPLVPTEHIRKAIGEFTLRLEALREEQGGHFEYCFKSFKVKKNRELESQCSSCNRTHGCPCDICRRACIESHLNQIGPVLADNEDANDQEVDNDDSPIANFHDLNAANLYDLNDWLNMFEEVDDVE